MLFRCKDKELKKYIKDNLKEEKRLKKIEDEEEKKLRKIEKEIGISYYKCDIQTYDDYDGIDDYIEENKKEYSTFQKMLFKLIDDKGLKDSDVYNKVHLDRRLFSKIRNDYNYHPSKETVILLGLSLELSEKEIDKLLESASYSLPRNNYYDLIIRYCFMKGIYKINNVNDLLAQYKCTLFSC